MTRRMILLAIVSFAMGLGFFGLGTCLAARPDPPAAGTGGSFAGVAVCCFLTLFFVFRCFRD